MPHGGGEMDTAHTTPEAKSRNSSAVRSLEAEWQTLVQSPWFGSALKKWGVGDYRLNFSTGEELLAEAQSREPESWAHRDRVLSALLAIYPTDPLARRVALQIVLPGLKFLIDDIRAWDLEERAARVLATGVEVLVRCSTHSAGTPPSFRVYANTRRRVLRAAQRHRQSPEVLTDGMEHFTEPGAEDLEDLVAWVKSEGELSEEDARLIVYTRAAGVPLAEYSSDRELTPEALRQRRLRAEVRLRSGRGLVLALAISAAPYERTPSVTTRSDDRMPHVPQPVQVALRSASLEQLDTLIRAGWERWCELSDELSSTGGMLPTPELVEQLMEFLAKDYWPAEHARVEALRRHQREIRSRTRSVDSRARGIA